MTKCLGYFVGEMEPLHVACPVVTDKGKNDCPVALELLSLSKSNNFLINISEPVTLATLVQMLKQLDPRFVACHDLHGTHIDVPSSHYG